MPDWIDKIHKNHLDDDDYNNDRLEVCALTADDVTKKHYIAIHMFHNINEGGKKRGEAESRVFFYFLDSITNWKHVYCYFFSYFKFDINK